MSDKGRLADRVAIITGAASGIGRATSELFASEGAFVLAVDREGSDLGFASDRIRPLVADITGRDAPAQIVAAALEAFGKVDILYNNAGMSERSTFDDMDEEFWDRTHDVNVKAAFRLVKAAIEQLKKSPVGRIISTASVAAIRSQSGLGAYSSSKAAMAAMTRSMAVEYGGTGLTANSILPGPILTQMTRATLGNDAYRETFASRSPLGRVGEAEDVARVALFFASDDSRYVTGQILAVDGGISTRA